MRSTLAESPRLVIVTGASGRLGETILRKLLTAGPESDQLLGSYFNRKPSNWSHNRLLWVHLDLCHPENFLSKIELMVKRFRSVWALHFACTLENSVALAYRPDVAGTIGLFSGLRTLHPKLRFTYASSVSASVLDTEYGVLKRLTEELLIDNALGSGTVQIVRIPAIYSAERLENFPIEFFDSLGVYWELPDDKSGYFARKHEYDVFET